MDLTLLLIAGAVVALVALAAAVVLYRSWGDFPARAGTLPATAPEPVRTAAAAPAAEPDADVPNAPVRITHPLVRRAIESALEQNSPIRRYVFREGPELFFTFEQIADPDERRAAYRLMRGLEGEGEGDVGAMWQLIRRLTREP